MGTYEKGEFHPEYGLYVQRPFQIVSQHGSNRFLDLIDKKKMCIKVSNGWSSQKWYFDAKTRTIKSVANNLSWSVGSAGRKRNMEVYRTSSEWFQIFKYEGEQFINTKNNEVIEINGAKDAEGQEVGFAGNNGKSHQKWTIRYLDSKKCQNKCSELGAKCNQYRGTLAKTKSGRTCQAWTSQSPHKHTRGPERMLNKGTEGGHNYCRNPDMGANTVWCYTTDAGKRWEVCDVERDEKCEDESTGLNEDFGFEANKPFYLRSRLAMRRVW
jgi:hypothetical protein